MKMRISELRTIIREVLLEDRGFGDQARDVKLAVDLIVDFLMESDASKLDGAMKIVRHNPVLLAQKVPGFKDALFSILRSVADPEIVKQAKESQKDINIAFTNKEDQLSTFASADNVVGFDIRTKKVIPGRVDFEVGLPEWLIDSFGSNEEYGAKWREWKKEYEKNREAKKNFNPGKYWKKMIDEIDDAQREEVRQHLVSGLSHEIGHFLELMRQGEKTFANVGGISDENAALQNLTSAIVNIAAGKSPEEIKLAFGEYDEFLKKINMWSKHQSALRLDRSKGSTLDRKMLAKLNSIYDAAIKGKYADMKPVSAYSLEKLSNPSFKFRDEF